MPSFPKLIFALLALLLAPAVVAQTVTQSPAPSTAAAPAYTAGFYYPGMQGVTAAGAAITTGTIRLHPLSITKPISIDGLTTIVSTLASGGNATLHLYSNVVGNRPTGTSANCTISTTTTGAKSCTFAGGPVAITAPGVYWLGLEVDATASATAIFQTMATGANASTYLVGYSATTLLTGGSSKIFLSWSHTYGNSSDITSATLTEFQGTTDAVLWFHVSSVP